MWLFEFVVGGRTRWWRHNTNPGYRVKPKFYPGGLANQIEIFKSNSIIYLSFNSVILSTNIGGQINFSVIRFWYLIHVDRYKETV